MLKKSLSLIQRANLIRPIFGVQKFIIYSQSKKKSFYSLTNNLIFKHACATPLTILLCSLEDAVINEKDKAQRKRLSAAFKATKRLSKIITSVTNHSSLSESFLISEAIKEVVLMFNRNNKDHVILSTTDIEAKLSIAGSKLYFQEALICLLKNSIEAYGTTVSKPVTLVARRCDNEIKLNLVDYACGMNGIARVMALHEGVSYKENGTGLGLFFTKRTIEEMFNGKFLLTSQVGLGTHISITIPVNQKLSNQNLLQS